MESPPRKLPPKKDVLDAFLTTGSARIFLDPRRTGAIVPKWFAKQAELVLRVGYTLSPPIPDLMVTEEAVSCTLSFNRAPFWCKMPWNAVFAVVSDVDGRGVVWPEDVPIESQLLKPSREDARPARPKPKLASVSSPKDDSAEAAGGDKDAEEEKRSDSEAPSSPSKTPLAAVPALAATPAEKPTEPAGPAESSQEPERPASAPEESEEKKDDESKDDDGGKKRKRPLPPYLRVVK